MTSNETSRFIKSLMNKENREKKSNTINEVEQNLKEAENCIGYFDEAGEVVSSADGIAKVIGLSGAFFSEVIKIGKHKGFVMEISIDYISVVMFGDTYSVREGDKAYRTKSVLKAPCGMELLGRVVNGIGDPIDMRGDINAKHYRPAESEAASVMSRESICKPLYTGTIAVDSGLAIGKGQRELIIGDRRTGKTTLAINAILNQQSLHSLDSEGNLNSEKDAVYCVYVSIGQQRSSVAKIVQNLRTSMHYTTVVAASASDPASERFIAPYLGCAIAEWFMLQGKNALIVFDDLSKQAIAYREISLLLRRPPGREAYPGDIFYIHSRLLERAANLNEKSGGGSLTALPIIETKQGNIAAYIPTNVISITDGQIYTDSVLANRNIYPAIDLPLSVSRVGSAAQQELIKGLSRGVKLIMSEYKEMLEFSKVSSSIDESSQKVLDKGKLLEMMFSQEQDEIVEPYKAAILLYIFKNNLIDLDSNTKSNIKYIKKNSLKLKNLINQEISSKELSQEAKNEIHKLINSNKKALIEDLKIDRDN